MVKARKRFILFAMLCVFVLLFVLLGIINVVNFTMAGEDADRVTEMLAQQQGRFGTSAPPVPDLQEIVLPETPPQGMEPQDVPAGDTGPQNMPVGFFPGFMGPMGPDSPEMESSLRYFTYSFDQDGNAERVALQISAVTEDQALAWARSLLQENETGWTRTSYRYRVYTYDGKTFVTVIDQGRELLPSFRILLISAIGLAVCLLASCVALVFVGRKLFRPLEEADRKQKRFIAEAEKRFKVPLTIINADTEIMERENGETEETSSINRQVKKMIGLVKDLSNIRVFDDGELTMLRCDLSALAREAADAMKGRFDLGNISLKLSADSSAQAVGDSEALRELLEELLENALKFSLSRAEMKVAPENGHLVITASNDTNLPDGSLDQVFDRFTRLDNAGDIPGAGLGLSRVREIVRAHNGRATAKAVNGEFILRIIL